jgi:hypothetical protein
MATVVTALTSILPQIALSAEKPFNCNPKEVAAFPKSRIHVACAPGDGAIVFFALGLSSQDDANRVLSLASTAVALKKTIQIFYDPSDLSGANIGCQTNDCRLIRGIRLFQ